MKPILSHNIYCYHQRQITLMRTFKCNKNIIHCSRRMKLIILKVSANQSTKWTKEIWCINNNYKIKLEMHTHKHKVKLSVKNILLTALQMTNN